MTTNPITYIYDPAQMEAIFEELTREGGEYEVNAIWNTKRIYDVDAQKWIDVENQTHDTFIINDVSYQWYHGHNMKHPQTPTLVAFWTSNHREDDWDEHEVEIDATAAEVYAFMRSVNGYDFYDGPDTIAEARGER
jgi:hypothetical protein